MSNNYTDSSRSSQLYTVNLGCSRCRGQTYLHPIETNGTLECLRMVLNSIYHFDDSIKRMGLLLISGPPVSTLRFIRIRSIHDRS